MDQLDGLAELAAEHGIPITVLGGGSNVLVSDAGVRGLVIANRGTPGASGDAAIAEPHGIPTAQLVADSGVLLAGLARTAIKAGFSGLEWAVSVPGTVGGAVIGNAGAHGGDIAGNLAEASRRLSRGRAGRRSPARNWRSPTAAACSNGSWRRGQRSRWC